MSTMYGGREESESHVFFKFPLKQRRRVESLNGKWPHVNEEMVIAKMLTLKNATKHRNLDTLVYNTKCKWAKQVKRAVLNFGAEHEWDYM